MNTLFFDTETCGKPKNYKAPLTDINNWPRLVQLGYIFMDGDGKQESGEFIVKPDGFEIPIEASNIHGITTAKALEVGIPLVDGLGLFEPFITKADTLIGHNISFDIPVAGAEFWRLWQRNPFQGKPSVDTMKSSTNFCALPGNYGYKYPKLSELYTKLFNQDMGAAHTALQDIQNTMKCYFELVKLGVIKV